MRYLITLAVLLMSTVTISAQEPEMIDGRILHNGVFYTLDESNKEATVVHKALDKFSSDKYTGDISIDSVINYNGISYVVTRIGESAFEGCVEITSFSAPNTLRIIDDEALSYVPFRSFRVPDGVERLGYRAFGSCEDLETVYLPESLKEVGTHVFGGDYNLKRINFPSQSVVDRLGKEIDNLTMGARLAKIYVNGSSANTKDKAKLPLGLEKYGDFYWINNAQGKRDLVNEQDKVIIPGGKYDKIYFEVPAIIVKKGDKYGAVSYTGKVIASPIYDKYEGSGREGRMLFSNKTPNGNKGFVVAKTGAVLASKVFTHSQAYSLANWINDWFKPFFATDIR